jgi:transposase
MLKPEEWMDIGLLHREGHSIKQIARMTGRSRNTVRRIVKQKVLRRMPAARRASKLDEPIETTGRTSVKGMHIGELRHAIDAVRCAAGLNTRENCSARELG